MLALSDTAFVDEHIPPAKWPSLKGNTPWGVVPTLTLPNGAEHGQSRALLRYLGKKTTLASSGGAPLYPEDALQALFVDEVCDFIEDIWGPLLQARAAKECGAFVGAGGQGAAMLDELETRMRGPCVAGEALTIADVYIFAAVAWWSSGFFKGVSLESLIGTRPKLRAVCERVGALPKVKAYYASKTLQPMEQAYGQLCKL
eukprot:g1316.t1